MIKFPIKKKPQVLPLLILLGFCIFGTSLLLSLQLLNNKSSKQTTPADIPDQDKISQVLTSCRKKGSEPYLCALNKLREVMRTYGVGRSFFFFTDSQAVNSSECHGLAHEFGKLVFKQTSANASPPLTQDTSFCEYGFWHGFLNAFIESDKSSDAQNVRQLCVRMDQNDMSPGKLVGWNCWHGLGLGAVGEPPKLSVWGDPRKMAESGFPLCEKIGTDRRQVSACVEGIFHSMITYMMLKQYKLSFDQNNPLLLCQLQKKYQHECYAQLAPQTSGFVFPLLMKHPEMVAGLNAEDRDLYVRSSSVARIRSQLNQPDFIDRFISDCHAMPTAFQPSCLNAGVLGVFIRGTDDEHKVPLQFCASETLSSSEKIDCYSALGQTFKSTYPEAELAQICSAVQKSYTDYCIGKSYRKPH